MSEEFEGAYQSTGNESEVVNESPIESTEQVQEIPAAIQDNPQAFRVKYNKEEVEIPYDQAPDYIQKGMNYDKVSQRATEYEQRIQDIAQITGYQTPDELFAAMEEAKQEQERAQYESAGITPEKFNELLEKHPEMQQLRQIQQQQQQAQQLQTEAGELFEAFPELTADSIPAEAWQMREQRGISLFDAYLRTTYKSLGQQKEQEAIQKLQTNAQSSPGSLSEGEPQHNTNVSSLSSKDFNSLVERVKRGENVQL